MKSEDEEKVLKNTKIISENTEEIKKTGVRNYNLEKHKRVWEALFYSHQRMDILIISISGGGIYVSLEAIKFFNEKGFCISWFLKISAISFVLAIILNFISQMMSGYVYGFDYQITDIEITCEEEEIDIKKYDNDIKSLNKKSERFEKYNKLSSLASISLMSLGLITLIIFFLITF